ncbi:hypothetical protein D3C85_1418110 [compost metagenome]
MKDPSCDYSAMNQDIYHQYDVNLVRYVLIPIGMDGHTQTHLLLSTHHIAPFHHGKDESFASDSYNNLRANKYHDLEAQVVYKVLHLKL